MPQSAIELQQHYEQLWQRFNGGLPDHLDAWERDVQAAQQAISQVGVVEAARMLCCSPQTQSLVRTGNPRWQDQVYEVLGADQERALFHSQRQQGEWVVEVLHRLLRDLNTQAFEGERYSVRRDNQTHSLTLVAKDGRGTIIEQARSYLVRSALLPQDLKAVEALNLKLPEKAAARLHSTIPSPQKKQGTVAVKRSGQVMNFGDF